MLVSAVSLQHWLTSHHPRSHTHVRNVVLCLFHSSVCLSTASPCSPSDRHSLNSLYCHYCKNAFFLNFGNIMFLQRFFFCFYSRQFCKPGMPSLDQFMRRRAILKGSKPGIKIAKNMGQKFVKFVQPSFTGRFHSNWIMLCGWADTSHHNYVCKFH